MIQPTSAVRVDYNAMIEMRDGVRLAADIFRPAGPGVFPTLLQRVPYGRSRPRTRDGALDVLAAARAGYAVVVQDCRGRGDSAGEFIPFASEAEDGFDTIEWAANQSWSSGRIGMFGRSYGGICQWLAAAARPPSLAAICPMFSGADIASDWFTSGGDLEYGFILLWSINSLAPEILARATGVDAAERRAINEISQAMDESEWHIDPGTLRESLGHLPFVRNWLSGDFGRSSEGSLINDIDYIPSLIIGGWYDIFMPGTIRTFRALAQRKPERHQLIIGPWAHGGSCTGAYPEVTFGRSASADAVRLTERQLDFFNRTLRGQGASPAHRILAFALSQREWKSLSAWPDGRVARWALEPSSSAEAPGGLTEGSANAICRGGLNVHLHFDEANPVPTVGGGTFLPGMDVSANSGPRDQRKLADRRDVLIFESEPLQQALELFGGGELAVVAGADDIGQRLVVRVADRSPEGLLLLVSEGASRLAATSSAPQRSTAQIQLSSTWWTIPKGHRIALLVSCTSYPRYAASAEPLAVIPKAGSVVLDLSMATLTLRLSESADRPPEALTSDSAGNTQHRLAAEPGVNG
jgi:uncharacterized protein